MDNIATTLPTTKYNLVGIVQLSPSPRTDHKHRPRLNTFNTASCMSSDLQTFEFYLLTLMIQIIQTQDEVNKTAEKEVQLNPVLCIV